MLLLYKSSVSAQQVSQAKHFSLVQLHPTKHTLFTVFAEMHFSVLCLIALSIALSHAEQLPG
jgi:hypothetical protein